MGPRRALLSVSDKAGLVEFAQGLAALGFEIVSTGGTAAALSKAGLAVTDVGEVTGFQEMMDGRVKTLHPNIHGGILANRGNPAHMAAIHAAGIVPIEVVAVNLYPFEATVLQGASLEDAIENIDIGGPAMVRAAAKNHGSVLVVVDHSDFAEVLSALEGGPTMELRKRLAAKAFRHTAFYDSMVSRYLTDEQFPSELTVGWRKSAELRYGENPHQPAALYLDPFGESGLSRARQLWGKELSYNNLLDAEAAWELVNDMEGEACVVVKHGNPCGAAQGTGGAEAYRTAKACDPVSAFGGIAAFREPVGVAEADAMTEKGNFLEVVIAPAWSEDALEVFRGRGGWGPSVRLLEAPAPPKTAPMAIRSMRGAVLVSTMDEDPGLEWTTVTQREPEAGELQALRLAWALVAHVKSNAIVLAGPDRLLGMGAGQPNRVQSVRLALAQAGEASKGAAMASDAFFPFPDSLEEAATAGVSCVVQPGGSKNDPAVIEAADRFGMAMVLTGTRHFRH